MNNAPEQPSATTPDEKECIINTLDSIARVIADLPPEKGKYYDAIINFRMAIDKWLLAADLAADLVVKNEQSEFSWTLGNTTKINHKWKKIIIYINATKIETPQSIIELFSESNEGFECETLIKKQYISFENTDNKNTNPEILKKIQVAINKCIAKGHRVKILQ